MIEIEFFGVRGSTPCSCRSTAGIGGNTSCVVLRCGDDDPIILDLGTGVRYLGDRIMCQDRSLPFSGTALVTHLHWDHIQGLPFFVPMLTENAELTIVGPTQEDRSLAEAIGSFVCPPLFPVDLDVLPGTVSFLETSEADLSIGSAQVMVRPVEHIGTTNGYRIDAFGGSVAYLPDHQEPLDRSNAVSPAVLELCSDVDVLIHDAQYDQVEFEAKADWGHSTIEYAVEVARQSEAQRLVLFHHDPSHSDQWVRDTEARAQRLAGDSFEVIAAHEQLVLSSGALESVGMSSNGGRTRV